MSPEQLRSWDGHDSETWHVRARRALYYSEVVPFGLDIVEKFADHHQRFSDERLKINVGGIELENPVMVGPGWDKVGEALAANYRLGYAGTEVGSVLAYPQPGNDKPRQWMVAPGVSFNRLGFNSPGMDVVANNLGRYRVTGQETGVVGISIGKNKEVPNDQAPLAHFQVAFKMYDLAGYFVINVSSPNTPGLRQLQDKEPLTDIVQAVNDAMKARGGLKPLFVKIAPDLEDTAVDDVIEVVLDNDLTGIIATNTTIQPDLKAKYGEQWRSEMGGLAGDDEDYRKMATEKVKHIYRTTSGLVDVIGVGGVNSTETALDKIQAGAKVVQVVTGIRGSLPLRQAIFEQGKVPGKINRGLVEYMEREGIRTLSEIVGSKSS